MPKSERLWPEGLVKVISFLLSPPSPSSIYPASQHLHRVNYRLLLDTVKIAPRLIYMKSKGGILLAQFTSKSEENLASGTAGPSSYNHTIKAWALFPRHYKETKSRQQLQTLISNSCRRSEGVMFQLPRHSHIYHLPLLLQLSYSAGSGINSA